uniref:Uncharacterized protein n=1 Tax=Neobodo designis TaxID=312471 RepID=A0A7S1QAY0_NEODS|mmetsp:Transcript_37162/g.114776  ORF Transcript_37162/g.114776 Transcript_37162/m.114776 type:complete len:401 (+) Transcript_37162:43-1245(+)
MRAARLTATAVTLLLAAAAVQAHICLTYPRQRGPAPRLFPGDPACFNRVGSCGSLPKGPATAKFVVGTLATLTFQQNLNHWYPPNPGFFDLAVSYDNEATWAQIGETVSDYPANNMNTQTDFTVPVKFPQAGHAIVRARYVSHNVNEIDPSNNTEAIFYSCADVEVTNMNGTVPTEQEAATAEDNARAMSAQAFHILSQTKHSEARGVSIAAFNCDAPTAFIAEGETRVQGGMKPVLRHTIHYDTNAGWLRWNRNDTHLGGTFDMTDLWNLTLATGGYTPQFIIGLNGANTCSMYGGDKFFPWAFGPKNGMQHVGNETRRDGSVMARWQIASADVEFTSILESAAATTCVPHLIRHGVLETELRARPVASIDPAVFAIPAVCQTHREMPDGGCKGRHNRQ